MPFRRLFLLLGLLVPAAIVAQTPDSLAVSPPRSLAPPIRLWHLGAAVGGVALISLADEDIRTWTVEHRSTEARDVARTWQTWGDARTPAAIAVTALAGGVVFRRPAVTRVGARLATSLIIATGLSRGTKRLLGRARPSAGVGAYDFDPWSDQSAFPSGHTTNAFLLSTTLADAFDRREATIGLYLVAGGTGVARVINDKHWVSDVVGGALLGTTVAKVVDGDWRIFSLRPPEFLAGPGGAQLRWQADLPALRR